MEKAIKNNNNRIMKKRIYRTLLALLLMLPTIVTTAQERVYINKTLNVEPGTIRVVGVMLKTFLSVESEKSTSAESSVFVKKPRLSSVSVTRFVLVRVTSNVPACKWFSKVTLSVKSAKVAPAINESVKASVVIDNSKVLLFIIILLFSGGPSLKVIYKAIRLYFCF